MTETRSTCPYCGVGCGVIIECSGNQITGVRGDPDHPANRGRLCTKGSTLHFTAKADLVRQTRLLHPMRRPARTAEPEVTTWDTALQEVSQRLADIWQQYGADAIGVYVSGQLLTEDYYVFNKLVKGLLGTNNIDTNSRLCMSSAVAGYKATLGADAPPCSYEDLAHAHTVLMAGSNMAWAHPVLFRRLEDAKRNNPAQKWIVIDPRRTEMAEQADLHLQLLPGSDIALFHGLLHVMLWEGLVNQRYIAEHTTGFDTLRDRVREFTPERTARLTGCKAEDIVTAARWFADSPATLSLYCQGLNQSSHGTDNNIALINLHLATGQIGKPGAGPFSLTGQPNAMGGREVGGMANLLSAHRDLSNAGHRADVARLWGVPDVPEKPGRTAVEMFQAAADGEIRALWIACTNPAQSLPDQATVRAALQRAEFVVVQEAYRYTATCEYADVLLPASSWGEKNGTVTNSERRISRVRPAVLPPGEARDDWVIARDIAHRLAERIGPARMTVDQRQALFDYPTAESVWIEHRESTRGRDLDITGLSWSLLDDTGPQQWPMRAGATEGTQRLYSDGVFPTPDGKARLVDVTPGPVAEPRSAQWPFSLTTGRLRDHWHGMSRTGTLGRLFGHTAEPALELHPQDMAKLRIRTGDFVRVQSRRGEIVLTVKASETIAPTQAFLPMHWGSEYLLGRTGSGQRHGGINELTTPTFCPRSRQPELKHTAVRIERVDLPWQLRVCVQFAEAHIATVRQKLMEALQAPEFKGLAYATVIPFGRETDTSGEIHPAEASAAAIHATKAPATGAQAEGINTEITADETDQAASGFTGRGIVLHAAATEAPHPLSLTKLHALLGLTDPSVLAYDDPRTSQQRRLKTDLQAGHLTAYWLAGDVSGHDMLDVFVQTPEMLPGPARQLLAPGALRRQLANVNKRSPQVCSCLNVSEGQILNALERCEGDADTRLQQLQSELGCGTQCGSCLPQLRCMIRTDKLTAASNA